MPEVARRPGPSGTTVGLRLMERRLGIIAVLVALLTAAAPGSALAAGKLIGTFAQATPTPTPAGEELSEDPGLPDGDDAEAAGGGDAGEDTDLPNTGAEPLLVALMGLGLVGTGLGLRRRIAHAGPTG